MNLYLAALYTNKYGYGQKLHQDLTDSEKKILLSAPNILESYHYVGKQSFVDEMRQAGAKVFLDSGAFSAYSLGVNINIDVYIRYIQENMDILRVEDGVVMASVLDGIGDPYKTWCNQVYMEQKGAKPLPCFHFGEDERYLEHYVANYEYITIGGMVGKNVVDLQVWLDRIWNKYMLDGAGRPKVKAHAFGITTVKIMERYPWYSVDSSSWIQTTAFGGIYLPDYGPIAVSEKSPSRKDVGRHFSTLKPIEQEHLTRLLEEDGFTYERLSTVYQSRAACNALGYIKLNHKLNQHFTECNGVLDCHSAMQLF